MNTFFVVFTLLVTNITPYGEIQKSEKPIAIRCDKIFGFQTHPNYTKLIANNQVYFIKESPYEISSKCDIKIPLKLAGKK